MSILLNKDGEDGEFIKVGDQAPDFRLETEKGEEWRLSDNLGKVIALLFYPKNETIVCTKQLCSVREYWTDYLETKALIVGVSPGTIEEHREFSQRHKLPIPLLADVDRSVTETYSFHWLFPTFFMRSIVIIDAKGFIRSRKAMLRAFRPADRDVITAIYAARADNLSEKYHNSQKTQAILLKMRLYEQIRNLFGKSAFNDDDREIFNDFRAALRRGEIRAAEKDSDGNWQTNGWVKQGILLGFKMGAMIEMSKSGESFQFFDKETYPLRPMTLDDKIRIVPGGSTIRDGSFVAPNVVLMPPCYVNVGAFVDEGAMIDSHALVGSCAQIGKRVHLSAAAQIGGVLEPINANPVIIEDDCFGRRQHGRLRRRDCPRTRRFSFGRDFNALDSGFRSGQRNNYQIGRRETARNSGGRGRRAGRARDHERFRQRK